MSLSSLHKSSFKKTGVFKTQQIFNPLVEGVHKSIPAAIHPIKLDIPAQNVPDITTSNPKCIIKLPRNGKLLHVAIRVDYGTTTTADYRDHLGVGMLQQIELKSSSKKLMEITDPRAALIYYLSKFEVDARANMLAAMGGTNIGSTSAAGSIMIPMPFFFDSLVFPGVAPLNCDQLGSDMEIHLTFKQNTSILKATGTGGSVTAVRAICYMLESEMVIKNVRHHSGHFDSVIQETTVATATETELDVKGISGNTKRLMLITSLSSDFLVDFYKMTSAHTSIEDDLNNSREDTFLVKNESIVDYLYYNKGRGFNASYGHPIVIPYTIYEKGYATNHVGGTHGAQVNQHILKYTHGAGANCLVSVMAVVSADYVYIKDGLRKLE